MTALEQVMQMKREGKGEGEIIAALKAQNIPPMQISDAINQSKIKEAVTDSNPTEGMMPSIMESEEPTLPPKPQEQNSEETYTPQPAPAYQPQPPQSMQQYAPAPQQEYAPQPAQQEQFYDPYSQPQQGYAQDTSSEFAPQQEYYGGDEYGGGYMGSTDTIIEVAEQVFQEKIKKISQEMKKLTEFRTIFEQRVENLSNRLERMEKNFDKMQLDILGKVSEYGKGLDYMQKELRMVEDSLGKFSGKL